MRERLLVFAPHPDDEVLGCGGTIARAAAQGLAVRVVIVTDGRRGLSAGQSPSLRAEESRCGLVALGIRDVVCWNEPDGMVPVGDAALARCRDLVLEYAPTGILLPAPTDAHADHRRVTRMVLDALAGVWAGVLQFYETLSPLPVVNDIADITAFAGQKEEALAAHASQLARFDYAGICGGLMRMRGAQGGVACAEAFLRFPWDGTPQRFFETTPLVSVIIRAGDMGFLRHALASVMRQTYDFLDVVLVWHGADGPDLSAFGFLRIRTVRGTASRGGNLNAGLDAAEGDFLLFLDQDDILYPEHVATLLSHVQADRNADIAYAGCHLVACLREGDRIRTVRRFDTWDRDVMPGQLLFGNLLPIHSMLFRRDTFRTERFDPELAAYEDWDMLMRLAADGKTFVRVGEVLCEYRFWDVPDTIPDDGVLAWAHGEKRYPEVREQVRQRLRARLTEVAVERLQACLEWQHGTLARREATIEQLENELVATRKTHAVRTARDTVLRRAADALGIDTPLPEAHTRLAAEALSAKPDAPRFSILMPVWETDPGHLRSALFSIAEQVYPGWELCLADDGTQAPETRAVLAAAMAHPALAERTRFTRREVQGGIVAATEAALATATAPWLVFADHDDTLHPEALLHLALAMAEHPDAALMYTDSRTVDADGEPRAEVRKEDWAPETLLHRNYVNHLLAVRRDAYDGAGGLDARFEPAQDWDLLLRLGAWLEPARIVHVPELLYDWRAAPSSVASSPARKPTLFGKACRAVEAHLTRLGLHDAVAEANPRGPGVICRWTAQAKPLRIIIPTHSNRVGLEACLAGIAAARYPTPCRITVMANRAEGDYAAFLRTLPERGITVLEDGGDFNWSRLNNRAVAASDEPWLLFLNDDTAMEDPGWLADLVRYLCLPGVGVVGAMLLYADGSIQHNGIAVDPDHVASNITSCGTRNERTVAHNVAAVTGACLLTTREVFLAAGGFDERFPVNFNDVDYCLKARMHGWRVLQAADVRIRHDEMSTRGTARTAANRTRLERDIALLAAAWGTDGLRDPYAAAAAAPAEGRKVLTIT